jgi:hypothetical protein
MTIRDFIDEHFRHFNAAALRDAAIAYEQCIADGGRMLVTLAGAMSTAELGRSLAEMIRRDKVHAICCTGANLEEDLFNLVAHDHYRARAPLPRPDARRRAGPARRGARPRHRHLHPRGGRHPKARAHLIPHLEGADADGVAPSPARVPLRPHPLRALEPDYEADPKNAWLLEACATRPADLRARLGGLHARQHLCCPTSSMARSRRPTRSSPVSSTCDPSQTGTANGPPTPEPPDSSRSAAASPATSRSASSRCSATTSRKTSRSGPTSARSATAPQATAPTPAPNPTRRSPGAS